MTTTTTRRATSATKAFAPGYRLLSVGVFTLILGIAFEFMAVATALPVAARDLGGIGLYPWALTGFLGAAIFGNGVAGEVADRVGPRLPMILGAATFAVGLVISGASDSMPMLIGGRVVQGFGSGFMLVAIYVVIGQCYDEARRPRVMSLISTAWVVPAVVGPFVSGGMTQLVSWRLAFLWLAPVVPLPLFAILPRLQRTEESGVRRSGRVPLAGAIAIGAGLMQWAGLEAEHKHWPVAAVGAVLGVTLLIAAARRLFPAGTLRLKRGLPSVVAFRGVMAGGFVGCEAYVPLMLVDHRGATPTLAGLAVSCTAVGWSTGSWWQGRPAIRSRRADFVRFGALITSFGILITGGAAIATSAVTFPGWLAGLGLAVGGLGMGLSMASNSLLLFDYSPVAEQGANSAALQMSDSLGGLLVIGAAGVVYAIWRESISATALFCIIFGIAYAVMLLAIVVGFRVRQPTTLTA